MEFLYNRNTVLVVSLYGFCRCPSKFSLLSSINSRCFWEFVWLTTEPLNFNSGWVGRFNLRGENDLLSLVCGIRIKAYFPLKYPVGIWLVDGSILWTIENKEHLQKVLDLKIGQLINYLCKLKRKKDLILTLGVLLH